MKRILLSFLLFSQMTAANDEVTQWKGGVDLGAWRSQFKQRAFGRQVSINTDPSVGLQLRARLQIASLFLEYAPFLYLAYLGGRSDSVGELNDVTYYSVFGLNIGFLLPILDIELYSGWSWSNFDFTFGNKTNFSGGEVKAGTAIPVKSWEAATLRLIAEYRRHLIRFDDSGEIPKTIKTSANVYFVGLGFLF